MRVSGSLITPLRTIPDLLQRRYGRFLDTWVCTCEIPDSERQRELLRRVQKSDMEKV